MLYAKRRRAEWLRGTGLCSPTCDPEGYKDYIAANGKALAKYGNTFLARGGKTDPREGKPRSRVIVVEFPSYAAALECYSSPDYIAAMKLRDGKAVWDMAITEGYEGPQPQG